jgi:hypothetical protein
VNRNAGGNRPGIDCALFDVRTEVGFVEYDNRGRVAFESGDDIAFEAPQIEVMIEALNQKDGVDVCGYYLFFRARACGFA